MVRAVLFDCDGVLVDSEVLALECELACLAEIGLTFDEEAYVRRHLGTSSTDFLAALEDEHQRAFGKPLPGSFAPCLRERYRTAFNTRLTAIAGVHEALLAHTGPRAVASSSSLAGLWKKLERTDLAVFFGQHVYSAEMVARGKPAPDLFLHAAAGLDARPADCIVIEDSVNGVRAAVVAGMTAIGFTGGGHCRPGHADSLRVAGASLILGHMDELVEALG